MDKYIRLFKLMNIILFIGNLEGGGAERILCELANYWKRKGYSIRIVTLIESSPFYHLENDISICSKGKYSPSSGSIRAIINNAKNLIFLQKEIKKFGADVVVSFTTDCNVIAFFCNFLSKKLLILSERTNPFFDNNFIRSAFVNFIYSREDKIVFQTHEIAKLFNKSRYYVIPNFIKSDFYQSKCNIDYNSKVIIAVGRLDKSKNFSFLVKAFANTKYYTGWELWIIGRDAGELDSLLKLSQLLKLELNVKFLGEQKNILSFFTKASIFAMCSIREGYPNSLIEAMAVGLAPIALNCKYGPKEIIRNKRNGYLIEEDDIESYTKALNILMSDNKKREMFGSNARNIVKTNNIDIVCSKWDSLLSNL